MRVPRLHVPGPLESGREIAVQDELAHYVRNVLRLGAGDALRVFDGEGQEFDAIISAAPRRGDLRILPGAVASCGTDSPLTVHLGLGLARGERMDYALQKATELGVGSITPLQLQRCNARFDEGRGDNRLRHWRQVIVSACEQSGRSRLPALACPSGLADWLAAHPGVPGLVFDPSAARRIDPAPPCTAVRVLVGPEGGLDGNELEQALQAGFHACSLGPRVLRAETAPVAVLAILQYLWGDL